MRYKNRDLIVVMIVVVLNIMWLQVPDHLVIPGLILALPLVFVFPGYALTQTLVRRRTTEAPDERAESLFGEPVVLLDQPIDTADEVLLSFGLSMAIDLVVGFGLNVLRIGLQAVSWVVSLGLVTTIFVACAMVIRRMRTPEIVTASLVRVTLQDGVLFVLSMCVVASAVWLSIIRPLQPQPSFTQFWILPEKQMAQSCAVSIGLQNFETKPETYRVVMTVNKTETGRWSSIPLSPKEKWIQSVSVAPDVNSMNIEAKLYRSEEPERAYREVHLTLNSSDEGAGFKSCK